MAPASPSSAFSKMPKHPIRRGVALGPQNPWRNEQRRSSAINSRRFIRSSSQLEETGAEYQVSMVVGFSRCAKCCVANVARGAGSYGSLTDIRTSLSGCPFYSHKADIRAAQREVSFGPIGDIRDFYSITSSARAKSADGTARPKAFAVFRLTTSSYLVGAWTGRSAGFSPLRMRST